jgi:hypothetical protein
MQGLFMRLYKLKNRKPGRSRFPCFRTFAAVLVLQGCSYVGETLTEAQYRDSGDKIRRSDAANLVFVDALALELRCPLTPTASGSPSRSPYSTLLMQLAVTPAGCAVDLLPVGASDDVWRGCAQYEFLDRPEVGNCRSLIQADPCAAVPQPQRSAWRLLTYQTCATALRVQPVIPIFLVDLRRL